MFDRLLSRLSHRRSLTGIYYELRTLRQMAEIVLVDMGYELPREARRRSKSTDTVDLDVAAMDEEQLAAREADRIRRMRLAGEDPGTRWEEDPNR